MREEKTVGLGRKILTSDDTPERFGMDARLAVQVLRDLGRVHAAGEYLASLDPFTQEHEAAADAFDQAAAVLDAYPSALLLDLAMQVERCLGALPGSEREHEAMQLRSRV